MTRINIKPLQTYKLDIGCKNKKKDGCIGIDINDYNQELVWDITNGIPFPDNSVDYVYMSHFIEHLEDRFISSLFLEIYRVCINGAIIDIAVPHSDTKDAYRLGHLSFWNEKRIEGITRSINGWLAVVGMSRNGIELKAKIRVIK
jgi:predicted SAM-dependent methyltransferase